MGSSTYNQFHPERDMSDQVERTPGAVPRPVVASNDVLLQVLQRMEQQLTALTGRMEAVEVAVKSGEGLAAMMADTVDDHMAQLQGRGIDVEARLAQASRIAIAATHPDVMHRLEVLLSRTDAIAQTLSAVSELPHLLGTMADTVDTTIGGLQARGIDVDERLRALLVAVDRLSSPSALRLLELAFGDGTRPAIASESEDPASPIMRLLLDAAEVSMDALRTGAEPVGMWGLLRAGGDASTRQLLGFGLKVARGLGARLGRHSSLPAVTR